MSANYGTLFLIPVPLSDDDNGNHIPEYNKKVVKELIYFVAENEKPARKFLKLFGYENIQRAIIKTLNQQTTSSEIPEMMTPLLEGKNIGLMSDAGCPGIADPGSEMIKLVHKKNIKVVPLTGPSSIVHSIMVSGFNGQNFAFNGYLPIEKNERIKKIKFLEQLSNKNKQAQFFIETPYRSAQMFDVLISTLHPDTELFIGMEITSAQQMLASKTASEWKRGEKINLEKKLCVFGIY